MAASSGERRSLKGAVPRHGKVTEVLPKVLVATWPETAPQRRPIPPGVRQKQKTLPKPIRASTFADAVPLSSKTCKVPSIVAKLQTVLHQQDARVQPFAVRSMLAVGDRGKYDLGLALKSIDIVSSLQHEDLLAPYTNSIWDFNASYTNSMLGDPVQSGPSRMSASAFSHDGPSPAQGSITDRDLQGRASASRMSEGPSPSTGSLTAREAQRSVRRKSFLESCGEMSHLQTCGSQRSRGHASLRPVADPVRLQHLQLSFHRSFDEVVSKLAELQEHPRWDIVMYNVSGTGTPQSSRAPSTVVMRMLAYDSDSEASDREESPEPEHSDDTLPAIKELFATSYLGSTPPLAQPTFPLDMREDAGVPKIKVAQEELLRAKQLLNVYRWFCCMRPVELHQDKIDACRLLNDALLPRPEVYVRHAQVESLQELGTRLGAFMAKNGRCMILNKEGSLISAVAVGVSSSHTAGWSCTSTPSPDLKSQRESESLQDLVRLRQEVNMRADRYARWLESKEKTYIGGSMDHTVFSTVDMRDFRRVSLDSFPFQLEGYKLFWLLSKTQGSSVVGINKTPATRNRRALARTSHFEIDALVQNLGERPGTSGTIGQGHRRPLQPDRSRPATSLGAAAKTRQVVWDEEETNRRREWSRAHNPSWGDQANTVAFRRAFLNPKLNNIGASRIHDTCVFWAEATTEEEEDEEGLLDPHDRERKSPLVGIDGFGEMHLPSLLEDKSLTLEASTRVEAEPDFVSFPPHGLCPMELLDGNAVPTWTIMPNSKMFQPTDELQVRMWRVKLIRGTKASEDLKGKQESALFLPMPTDVQRMEELTLTSVTCDCSARGNPFCIIFRPEINRVWEGDQFEVELLGLRGEEQTRSFFYDFHSLLTDSQDYGMLQAAKNFREMLDDEDNYKALQLVAQGSRIASRRLREAGAVVGSRAGFHDADRLGAYSVLDLGLVTHPNQYIAADQNIITICVECKEAIALEARLMQLRAAGNTIVKRAVLVIKMESYFYVRIKLPCSFSVFEVSFHIASTDCPGSLQEHPFRYNITASESCRCPLSTIDHPLFSRFGFCPQPAAAQQLGLTVIAPVDYSVRAGRVYFMVHIKPKFAKPQAMAQPTGSMPTSLLFRQIQEDAALAQNKSMQKGILDHPDPLFEAAVLPSEEASKSNVRRQTLLKGMSESQHTSKNGAQSGSAAANKLAAQPAVGAVRRMHHQLETALVGNTQDASGILHFDLRVTQAEPYNERYVGRLHQKPGYEEIYDGYLYLNDQDVGSSVELYVRLARGEGSKNAALKVGEWTIGYHNEALPAGI
eukprot:TRINITY_DN57195_c0_g1_i1.p1 TRINITY_DN57195_c0_g1~~TRINITY_DN57195_c0_g1_i1.p1  ORF type:complete len:1303 (-),score=205.14 TRINITY_DN57195_c0_g1_i1:50-3958(-)